MNTVGFLITKNTNHHVFSKNTFKYMYVNYTSGATGSIYLYFSAEGEIVDNDLITLTVKKDYISVVTKTISEQMSLGGYHEYTTLLIEPKGINKHIDAISYTAG
jgi:hypothetical protein|tara:strand:+ start:400 stop:711 length:312 start_codon:yes stop_codon:yes gene_type:complete